MAKATTTHVVEIETGIGEPAFIPLSLGQELQPISVGKKGMWRIESARVLDVHAFVYFDGTSLFLQSADEQNPASVDGYRVGKAWTELHAPCKIEVGAARLRYRSLIADADNQPTLMATPPLVQAPPGGPGGPLGPLGPLRPGAGASMPVAAAPPPPAPGSAAHLQTGGVAPIAFPKTDRPFKPGEFSLPPAIDESTRVAPIDATNSGRTSPGLQPRPAAGQPAPGDPSARPDAAHAMHGNTSAIPAPYGPGGHPQQGQPQQHPQQGQPQQQQAYGAHGGYSNPAGSGTFNAMSPSTNPQIPGPPAVPGQLGPSLQPGGYGSMTPQGGMQPPTGPRSPMEDFVAKLKANSIPKMIAGVLFIIGGILYLAEDDEPQVQPKKKVVATLDGGSAAAGTGAGAAPTAPPVMTQTPVAPAWPAGVPCPPPNWPPGTPLPCTPNGVRSGSDRTPPEKGSRDGGKGSDGKDPKDAGASALPAGTKTLERQAVDYVAAGDTAKAAAAYEELVRRDPNNKVYAEAARILRAKLDGGVPGP